ncbi:uncharacterized protein LOC143235217 [Tachypleus tridentatus]|uniref:uncharacterized protein LOC143235217 n=1 Tax=Tachypleus tridentatus TaxID=6853 RepID=UPI003FD150F6
MKTCVVMLGCAVTWLVVSGLARYQVADIDFQQTWKHRAKRQIQDLRDTSKSSFNCTNKRQGEYYADPKTHCQVYYVCLLGSGGRMEPVSFVCPNGTVFSQSSQVCSPRDRVPCSLTTLYNNLHADEIPDEQKESFVTEKVHLVRRLRRRKLRRRPSQTRRRYHSYRRHKKREEFLDDSRKAITRRLPLLNINELNRVPLIQRPRETSTVISRDFTKIYLVTDKPLDDTANFIKTSFITTAPPDSIVTGVEETTQFVNLFPYQLNTNSEVISTSEKNGYNISSQWSRTEPTTISQSADSSSIDPREDGLISGSQFLTDKGNFGDLTNVTNIKIQLRRGKEVYHSGHQTLSSGRKRDNNEEPGNNSHEKQGVVNEGNYQTRDKQSVASTENPHKEYFRVPEMEDGHYTINPLDSDEARKKESIERLKFLDKEEMKVFGETRLSHVGNITNETEVSDVNHTNSYFSNTQKVTKHDSSHQNDLLISLSKTTSEQPNLKSEFKSPSSPHNSRGRTIEESGRTKSESQLLSGGLFAPIEEGGGQISKTFIRRPGVRRRSRSRLLRRRRKHRDGITKFNHDVLPREQKESSFVTVRVPRMRRIHRRKLRRRPGQLRRQKESGNSASTGSLRKNGPEEIHVQDLSDFKSIQQSDPPKSLAHATKPQTSISQNPLHRFDFTNGSLIMTTPDVFDERIGRAKIVNSKEGETPLFNTFVNQPIHETKLPFSLGQMNNTNNSYSVKTEETEGVLPLVDSFPAGLNNDRIVPTTRESIPSNKDPTAVDQFAYELEYRPQAFSQLYLNEENLNESQNKTDLNNEYSLHSTAYKEPPFPELERTSERNDNSEPLSNKNETFVRPTFSPGSGTEPHTGDSEGLQIKDNKSSDKPLDYDLPKHTFVPDKENVEVGKKTVDIVISSGEEENKDLSNHQIDVESSMFFKVNSDPFYHHKGDKFAVSSDYQLDEGPVKLPEDKDPPYYIEHSNEPSYQTDVKRAEFTEDNNEPSYQTKVKPVEFTGDNNEPSYQTNVKRAEFTEYNNEPSYETNLKPTEFTEYNNEPSYQTNLKPTEFIEYNNEPSYQTNLKPTEFTEYNNEPSYQTNVKPAIHSQSDSPDSNSTTKSETMKSQIKFKTRQNYTYLEETYGKIRSYQYGSDELQPEGEKLIYSLPDHLPNAIRRRPVSRFRQGHRRTQGRLRRRNFHSNVRMLARTISIPREQKKSFYIRENEPQTRVIRRRKLRRQNGRRHNPVSIQSSSKVTATKSLNDFSTRIQQNNPSKLPSPNVNELNFPFLDILNTSVPRTTTEESWTALITSDPSITSISVTDLGTIAPSRRPAEVTTAIEEPKPRLNHQYVYPLSEFRNKLRVSNFSQQTTLEPSQTKEIEDDPHLKNSYLLESQEHYQTNLSENSQTPEHRVTDEIRLPPERIFNIFENNYSLIETHSINEDKLPVNPVYYQLSDQNTKLSEQDLKSKINYTESSNSSLFNNPFSKSHDSAQIPKSFVTDLESDFKNSEDDKFSLNPEFDHAMEYLKPEVKTLNHSDPYEKINDSFNIHDFRGHSNFSQSDLIGHLIRTSEQSTSVSKFEDKQGHTSTEGLRDEPRSLAGALIVPSKELEEKEEEQLPSTIRSINLRRRKGRRRSQGRSQRRRKGFRRKQKERISELVLSELKLIGILNIHILPNLPLRKKK